MIYIYLLEREREKEREGGWDFDMEKSGEKRKRKGDGWNLIPFPIDVCKGQMWFLKRGPNVENNFFSWQIFLTLGKWGVCVSERATMGQTCVSGHNGLTRGKPRTKVSTAPLWVLSDEKYLPLDTLNTLILVPSVLIFIRNLVRSFKKYIFFKWE